MEIPDVDVGRDGNQLNSIPIGTRTYVHDTTRKFQREHKKLVIFSIELLAVAYVNAALLLEARDLVTPCIAFFPLGFFSFGLRLKTIHSKTRPRVSKQLTKMCLFRHSAGPLLDFY